MLVLSRNPGEKVIIDGDIVIQVLSVKGSQVKIGFSAPQEMTILREELHNKITNQESVEVKTHNRKSSEAIH